MGTKVNRRDISFPQSSSSQEVGQIQIEILSTPILTTARHQDGKGEALPAIFPGFKIGGKEATHTVTHIHTYAMHTHTYKYIDIHAYTHIQTQFHPQSSF